MSAPHGYGGYTNGCRCEVCREAKREYERAIRARRRESGEISHGKRVGYDSGCRCDDCRLARKIAYRRAPSEYQATRPNTAKLLDLARKTGRLA